MFCNDVKARADQPKPHTPLPEHTKLIVRPEPGGDITEQLRRARQQISKFGDGKKIWFQLDDKGNPHRKWRSGTYAVHTLLDKNLPAIKLMLELAGFTTIRKEIVPASKGFVQQP